MLDWTRTNTLAYFVAESATKKEKVFGIDRRREKLKKGWKEKEREMKKIPVKVGKSEKRKFRRLSVTTGG